MAGQGQTEGEGLEAGLEMERTMQESGGKMEAGDEEEQVTWGPGLALQASEGGQRDSEGGNRPKRLPTGWG